MKLFVLVRRDLSESYRAVQAGHAVAEFLLRHPETQWDNGTLVYLGVNDEKDLSKWSNKLDVRRIEYEMFNEPDIGDQDTALACVGNDRVFKSLKLL